MSEERRLTSSRLGRLSQLGRLAGGMAGGAIAEGARQLASGQRPSLGDLLLTPGNAQRLGDRLSEMRGAAMKIGQLLSMDSGHLLPQAFTDLLNRLRDDAHSMPLGQVAGILKQHWGEGWERQFQRFAFTPLAAASIGQVHDATLKNGQRLAIKIQYPGIADSIDSDIDNVATLLRVSNILPKGLDLEPLLREAKQQLHAEADYQLEAQAIGRFAACLKDDNRFELPGVEDALTTQQTLAMHFLDGQPIESLIEAPSGDRNAAAAAMLELALREVFDFGWVQTDPNFANYLYSQGKKRIQLLDFGASRHYPAETQAILENLLRAGIDGNADDIAARATDAGYLAPDDPAGYRDSIVKLLRTVTEPARTDGDYAFAASDLAARMKERVLEMRMREKFTRVPPPSVLFLHRKLGGLYLLFSRIGARIPVAELIAQQLDRELSSPQNGELRQAV